MKARITIEKSFEEGKKSFSKQVEKRDFETFLKEEGEYLDKLAETVRQHGNEGDGFTVTYIVTLEK